MAAVRTEESLTECNKPLEVMDAAECDGDQQLNPSLVGDTPEKDLMLLLIDVTLLFTISTDGWYFLLLNIMTNPNLVENNQSDQQGGSPQFLNYGCF